MNTLTQLEQDILELVQKGLTNYKIVAKMNIMPSTLRDRLRSIKAKLGVNTRNELIALREDK